MTKVWILRETIEGLKGLEEIREEELNKIRAEVRKIKDECDFCQKRNVEIDANKE